VERAEKEREQVEVAVDNGEMDMPAVVLTVYSHTLDEGWLDCRVAFRKRLEQEQEESQELVVDEVEEGFVVFEVELVVHSMEVVAVEVLVEAIP
jgi:hypothetical protein